MNKIFAPALLGGLTAGAAHSATTTTTFVVTATVQSTCSATATALAFPAYTPGGGAKVGTSTAHTS